jgi:hypothetical protein
MIVTAMIDGTLGDTKSQTADVQRPMVAARLAADIAREMNIRAPRVPSNAPLAFGSATSHDQIVETRWVIKDPFLFSVFKNGLSSQLVRVTKATRYCTERNIAAMMRGVEIHEILTRADGSDPLDYKIDASLCEVLPKPPPTDAATLVELAREVARAENSRKPQPGASFRLDGAVPHGEVVEERLIVRDTSVRDGLLAERAHFEGLQKDYLCPTYRNDMFRGVAFHLVFMMSDGSPVLDVAINKSNC